uniref:MAS-related GPR, member X1 n=1 Tax=Nannospalax galili TaxID=1026970 RepID=A0A8C6QG05_NANGA
MNLTISSQNTESTPTNGTGQPLNQNCAPILSLHFLIVILALVGLAGNAIVLWLLGFRMRRNAISVYILNLALADFLFLCCHIIDSLLRIIDSYGLYAHNLSKEILNNGAIIPYMSGLSILSAISTERCLSVLWPIWYHCHRPRNMSVIVCALIWVLSLLMTIHSWYYTIFINGFQDVHKNLWKKADFIITAYLIFLFVVLSGSSLALLVRILCGSRRIPVTRLYATICLTVIVFLICGLPLGIYFFLLFWLGVHLHYPFCHTYRVTVVLSCVNCYANPTIYFFVGSFRKRRQHQSLKMVLQRALQDTPKEEGYTTSHLQETMETSESKD